MCERGEQSWEGREKDNKSEEIYTLPGQKLDFVEMLAAVWWFFLSLLPTAWCQQK
jgi:hypothetical protein